MTAARPGPEADTVADALRHVLMDAFSLHSLALCAAWNMAGAEQAGYAELFRKRARSAQGAAHLLAKLLRRRSASVALHPSDPSELPRWMFAAPAPEPVMLVALLAEATAEFAASLEAAAEVARAEGDRHTRSRLARRLRAERRTAIGLAEVAEGLAQRADFGRVS